MWVLRRELDSGAPELPDGLEDAKSFERRQRRAGPLRVMLRNV